MNPYEITVEYPYYRVLPQNWSSSLSKLISAGVERVSFYVPPILHNYKRGNYYLRGESIPQQNLELFLSVIRDLGLKATVKLGPFVHAELKNGGIPTSWLNSCPTVAESIGIYSTLDGRLDLYEREIWSSVSAWIGSVREYVESKLGDNDTVWQIGNEGAIGDFGRNLNSKVAGDEIISQLGRLSSLWFGQNCFINVPIPSDEVGSDEWLEWERRVEKLHEFNIPLRRTEWAGNPRYSESALLRYKRASEIGLSDVAETNWGFSWGKEHFDSPDNPLFLSILNASLGARQLSAYVGISGEVLPSSIKMEHHCLIQSGVNPLDHGLPYCKGAPVSDTGAAMASFSNLSNSCKMIEVANKSDWVQCIDGVSDRRCSYYSGNSTAVRGIICHVGSEIHYFLVNIADRIQQISLAARQVIIEPKGISVGSIFKT